MEFCRRLAIVTNVYYCNSEDGVDYWYVRLQILCLVIFRKEGWYGISRLDLPDTEKGWGYGILLS